MMDKKEEEAKELGDALVFMPLGFAVASALWFRFEHTEASFVATLVALGFLLGVLLASRKPATGTEDKKAE
jgi:predicted outer membrane lipoprotein